MIAYAELMPLDCHLIPYQPDAALSLAALEELPYPLLLDSNDPLLGRYHIITACPSQWVSVQGRQLSCKGDAVERYSNVNSCPAQCWQALDALKGDSVVESPLPFPGGIAGFLSYEFGVWEHLGRPPSENALTPALWAGRYDWALITDLLNETSQLVFAAHCPARLRHQLLSLYLDPAQTGDDFNRIFNELTPDSPTTTYWDAIARIHRYIEQGDCYQINFTHRFSTRQNAPTQGINLYRNLRSRQSAPFAAYLGLPGNTNIMSFSPERLVSCTPAGQVLAQPIKGTAKRGKSPAEDMHQAEHLVNSAKDKAENLMIVDLLRNDLSKVCQAHSVTVPKLFELQTFTNVHHLVSSVTGQLKSGESAIALFRACFPGGSVTGAPKRRAMEIIEELESHSRSVFCGSIFYWGDNNTFDASITIRTLVQTKAALYCWAGGAITIDSNTEAEYQESLDKIERLTSHG